MPENVATVSAHKHLNYNFLTTTVTNVYCEVYCSKTLKL